MHDGMAGRHYDFRPPLWRPRRQLHVQSGLLGAGSLVWLAAYGWLARELWLYGVGAIDWFDGGVIAFIIGLGILLALGWRSAGQRWFARLRPTRWPALSLAELLALSPSAFEEYVAQRLFARHGYVVENTPDVQDGGVDILVTDPYGRRAVVQCKRYRSTVGVATLRDLYGALMHQEVHMAYLVTTAGISDAAREWVAGKPIVLIDGERLVMLSRAEPIRPAGQVRKQFPR